MSKTTKQILAIVGGIVLIAIVLYAITGTDKHEIDMTIDGEPVSDNEYARAMSTEIANVINYYENIEQGVASNPSFWTDELGDKRPVDLLVEYTRKEVQRTRAIYQLAVENGDLDTVSFDAIDERLEAENEMRQEAIDSGEPIIGASRFTKDEFTFYEMQALRKSYIDNHDLPIEDVVAQDYYFTNKDQFDTEEKTTQMMYIKLDEENVTDEIKADLENLYSDIQDGTLLEIAAQDYPSIDRFVQVVNLSDEELALFENNLSSIIDVKESIPQGENSVLSVTEEETILLQDNSPKSLGEGPLSGYTEEVKQKVVFQLQIGKYNEIVEEQMNSQAVNEDTDKSVDFALSVLYELMEELSAK